MLLNSFAWSKSIDVAPCNMETGNNSNYFTNFYNRRNDKGISDYDQPFQNTTSFVWDLPVGKGRRLGSQLPGYADAVVGGSVEWVKHIVDYGGRAGAGMQDRGRGSRW